MDGEKNDVFYIITVQTNGLLRFKLTPNNPNNDYDWAVFNMTNADCPELYPNAHQLQHHRQRERAADHKMIGAASLLKTSGVRAAGAP